MMYFHDCYFEPGFFQGNDPDVKLRKLNDSGHHTLFYKYCCNKNAYLWHNSALLGAQMFPLSSNYTEREVILPTIGAISAEKPEVVILINHIPLSAWLRH